MRARKKVLLALLLHARREPTRTQLMKWVFLLRQETSLRRDRTFYDFLPYRYGPFSFEVYRELGALAQCGFIGPRGLGIREQMRGQAMELEATLAPEARRAVGETLERYGHLGRRRLVDLVYRRYPWYASRRSGPVPDRQRLPEAAPAVYTIGYQGRSVDGFLNELLLSGIRTLIDVRSNPVSRKYGFSGKSLGRLLTGVGLRYVQFPSLGIERVYRKTIGSELGRDGLLDYYEREVLPGRGEELRRVGELLRAEPCALMCFEREGEACHRSRLARQLAGLTDLAVVHL